MFVKDKDSYYFYIVPTEKYSEKVVYKDDYVSLSVFKQNSNVYYYKIDFNKKAKVILYDKALVISYKGYCEKDNLLYDDSLNNICLSLNSFKGNLVYIFGIAIPDDAY